MAYFTISITGVVYNELTLKVVPNSGLRVDPFVVVVLGKVNDLGIVRIVLVPLFLNNINSFLRA